MMFNRVLLTLFVASISGIVACGREDKPRKAVKLEVDGLTSAKLSLALSQDERCGALVEYVSLFSQQHAPGVYSNTSCSGQKDDELKVGFSVLDKPNGKSIGEMIVYVKESEPSFLLCQIGSGATKDVSPESYCAYLRAHESVDGLPEVFRKESIRLQDFVVSFLAYVQE